MTWFLFAIIGHLFNGVAFVIDKALLSTAFKRSATYAGLVGILSLFVLVAIPWVEVWPRSYILVSAFVSGATFIFALRGFFAALSRSEASRVVPIVGSLIPILTLIGTFTFLGERLSQNQLIGFALLILATIILSGSGGLSRPSKSTIAFAIGSAVLFAISSVTGKAVYDSVGFLSGFIVTRMAAAGTAVIMVTLLDPFAGKELLSMIKKPKGKKKRTKMRFAAPLAIFGQSMGAIGFLFVQWGIARGSASIVNALQAVQYAFLVLIAFALYKYAPKLLNENLRPKSVIIKVAALVITAIGLAMVV
ncbi:MAG: DMT family transporter [Patescibacteria group bacterium]|nr:DMT family transporter [Patescibacteria group bacterium]MBU2509027.1 DMT family transporter [Patescibacteria group bacterium]